MVGCSYPTTANPAPGACAPFFATASSPPVGALDVPTDTAITVVFSDYPDPDTVSVADLLVTSGVYRVPEAYRVDLADKAITMTPDSDLTSNLGYTVNVEPGIASLAGCGVAATQRAFTTGSGPANPPAPAVPTMADVQPIFDASCGGGCHADASGGCLSAPVEGLSLCAADARDALIDVPSREAGALALVAPRDSARSYLLRKLLPATSGGGPIPGTFGERDPPGAPLPLAQLETITAWIDGGALP